MVISGGTTMDHGMADRLGRVTRRRLAGCETPESPPAGAPFKPSAAFVMSVWFGLATGLTELVLTVAQKPLHDPSPGFFRMNRHILWTIPTVNLALFGLAGMLLSLVVRTRPRRAARLTAGLLGVLSMLTLLLSCRRLHTLACVVLAVGLAYRL